MIPKDVNIEKVTKGRFKGLFRLKIKAKYNYSFIIDCTNVNQLKKDISEVLI